MVQASKSFDGWYISELMNARPPTIGSFNVFTASAFDWFQQPIFAPSIDLNHIEPHGATVNVCRPMEHWTCDSPIVWITIPDVISIEWINESFTPCTYSRYPLASNSMLLTLNGNDFNFLWIEMIISDLIRLFASFAHQTIFTFSFYTLNPNCILHFDVVAIRKSRHSNRPNTISLLALWLPMMWYSSDDHRVRHTNRW